MNILINKVFGNRGACRRPGEAVAGVPGAWHMAVLRRIFSSMRWWRRVSGATASRERDSRAFRPRGRAASSRATSVARLVPRDYYRDVPGWKDPVAGPEKTTP